MLLLFYHLWHPQIPAQSEPKATQPTSPVKNHEQNVEEPTNQKTEVEPPPNHRTHYEPTNHKPPEQINQRQPYDISTQNYAPPNQRPGFELGRQYETNQREQRTFENQRPPSFDSQKFEPNARAQNEPHRPVRLPHQDSQELQHVTHSYPQGFRHDEVILCFTGRT